MVEGGEVDGDVGAFGDEAGTEKWFVRRCTAGERIEGEGETYCGPIIAPPLPNSTLLGNPEPTGAITRIDSLLACISVNGT